MRTSKELRFVIEAAIMIGLAFVLNMITLIKLPQGGSVTAGSMIPILIIAYRWGLVRGLLVGGLFGVMQMLFGGYVITPVQAMLDYPLAFAALGLAGLFANKGDLQPLNVGVGVVVAMAVRTLSHVISGVVFFAEYAPENMSPWLYSIIYNGSYMGIEAFIAVVVILVLSRSIKKELVLQA